MSFAHGRYTALPYNGKMVSFIQTRHFTRLVQEYLTDAEYRKLHAHLIADPSAGAVMLRRIRDEVENG
jgi:hypothetical protein